MLQPIDRHWWLMPTSLFAAFLWQIWPLSPAARQLAPDAILLVSLHWVLRKPHAFGSGSLFIIGLFRDGIEGSMLGQHALALVITGYFVQLFYQRMRMFAIWQQSLAISALSGFYLTTCSWIHLLNHHANSDPYFLAPAITTGICWPICNLLLHQLQQVFLRRPA